MKDWKQINKVTLDFFNAIPDRLFHKKPFSPRFKSFSWEFACILSTRKMYLLGIKDGNMNGNVFCEKDDFLAKYAKKEMIKKLRKTNNDILKLKNKEIIFFGKKMKVEKVMCWLMQHEQMHYGKLMLYCAKANIKLPCSFRKMWGL